ncbi:MAG: HU family DNA-binding protein [Muribaculaceae bacterium]|nr:HU family DNA-binding protein [Muribaculaceae bacterium]
MYDKITLPSLISLLAEKTGKQKKQCEDFLRELFSVITETLCNGENVKIKSIGTFKVIDVEARKSVNVNTGEDIEIPGHRKIVFIPTKEMAEDVNSPFSMFETVEINASVDNGEEKDAAPSEIIEPSETIPHNNDTVISPAVEEIEQPNDSLEATKEEIEKISAATDLEIPSKEEPTEDDDEPVNTDDNRDTVADSNPEPTEDSNNIIFDDDDSEEEDDAEALAMPVIKRSFKFIWGFVAGILCMALIAIIGYLFIADKFNEILRPKQDSKKVEKVVAENDVVLPDTTTISIVPASQDTINRVEPVVTDRAKESTVEQVVEEEVAPTQPSDEKVYDTISKTRYLTTMAKSHYGNYNLWPYIYEENKTILGHPDRIRPGTRVVIPDLSKYGVNPNKPEDIKRAKQKGVEIYARFNK